MSLYLSKRSKDKVNFPVATNEHWIYTVPKDKVILQANQYNALLYRLTTSQWQQMNTGKMLYYGYAYMYTCLRRKGLRLEHRPHRTAMSQATRCSYSYTFGVLIVMQRVRDNLQVTEQVWDGMAGLASFVS